LEDITTRRSVSIAAKCCVKLFIFAIVNTEYLSIARWACSFLTFTNFFNAIGRTLLSASFAPTGENTHFLTAIDTFIQSINLPFC
jgi:hypothetical protein